MAYNNNEVIATATGVAQDDVASA